MEGWSSWPQGSSCKTPSIDTFEYRLVPAGGNGSCTCALVETDTFYDLWTSVFKWIDLALLIFFTAEISLNVFVIGFDYLRKSPLNSIDAGEEDVENR